MTEHPSPGALLREAREHQPLSIRALAREARVSDTLWRNVEAGVRTRPDKLIAMARAVGADAREVLDAAGFEDVELPPDEPARVAEPLPAWRPPAAAHRMTLRQRRAVESLIAVLTEVDDRQTEDKSAEPDLPTGVVPNVTVERVGNGDDPPIKLAGAGPLPPLTPTADEYLVAVSDALYEKIKERLLNE